MVTKQIGWRGAGTHEPGTQAGTHKTRSVEAMQVQAVKVSKVYILRYCALAV